MLKLLGEDEAYEIVSKKLQYQLITPTPHYETVLRKVVRDLPVTEDSLQRGIGEMMAVGNADRCLDTFDRFLKAGATHLHVSSFMAGRETYRRAAKMIISHFS
jgi:alkanesulfonate monooxygenase SsuD/methylene tetrahydromethanopterin reductase-like flavin-dependent oxidoreductase (luciferase family)